MLGLHRDSVRLEPYLEEWANIYNIEKRAILAIAGGLILDIQHVGSTSIPELCAKPIIDIAVGVKELKTGEKLIELFERLGYEYRGSAGVERRHFFAKGPNINRTHYIHVVELNGENWNNMILFRDFLLRHHDILEQYMELKKKLAEKYPDNRQAYTEGKSEFITMVLEKARAELSTSNVI